MEHALPASVDEQQVHGARRRVLVTFVLTVAFLGAIPVAALALQWPGAGMAAALLALLLAAVALHGWRFRCTLRDPGCAVPRWYVPSAATLTLALWCVGIATGWLGYAWATIPALLLGDIVIGRGKPVIATWVVLATALTLAAGLLIQYGTSEPGGVPFWVAPAIGAFYIATMWICNVDRFWWLRSVVRLDESRRSAGALAAAQERLRLADDLHDILGHALEVVAFKSELATRLLPQEAERARAEMEDVQRVAREAMSEVRTLARQRRGTDLATELRGARAVLASAGVALEVTGDPLEVPPAAQEVLGRVLRETMTNVLRHAEATRCSITIGRERGGIDLLVVNDGVDSTAKRLRAAGGGAPGSGLPGLERYLGERSGTLRAGPGSKGTFSVHASVPAASA